MFDLTNAKSNNFENLPDGKYAVACTDAVMKDTKDATGEYIKATFTIVNGEHKDRKIYTNFNVKNKNPKASEIGMGQLKSFLENSNYKGEFKFETPNDVPVAMCGLIVGVKTKTKTDPTYGDKTEVSYFYKPTETAALKNEEIPF